jgi:hypothetical protein
MSGQPNLFAWEYGQILVACTVYNEINEEKHKLVHTINRSPDRASNLRPLVYCGMVHQGISRRVLRGNTYDPGHWTFYLCRRGFGLLVSIVVPLMLAVLPYARGHGFDSRSGLLFIVWTNLCFSLFIVHRGYIQAYLGRCVALSNYRRK